MQIVVRTVVDAELVKVKEGFTEKLFLSLNPPFPKVKLLQFDGSKEGDVVSLELNFVFFRQTWTSLISTSGEDKKQWYFIDEGTQLPFFLTKWKHRHVVESHSFGSVIIDDINYHTGTLITDWLLFPLLWMQFLYRKPIYKRYFKK